MIKFFKNVAVRIISITLLVLFIASLFLCREWYKKQYHKAIGVRYVYIADKYYAKGQLNNAVKFYNLGLKEYPEHSQARCNLAEIYVMYEDYGSAVNEYRTALKYNPKYMSCRVDFGVVLSETLSQYDEAILEYQKVADTKRIPIIIPFVYNNTKATKENKEYAYYNMGLAYRGKTLFTPREKLRDNGYLKEAVKSYDKAVKINNNRYESFYNLALTHHLLGNKKEAGLNYCKAIEINPQKYEAHLNLAILLDGMKYYPEAISEFRKAGLLIDSGDYETILFLNGLLNDSYKKDAIYKEINNLYTEAYLNDSDKNTDEEENFFKKLFKFKKKDKNKKKNLDQKEQNVIFKKGKAYPKEESENQVIKKLKRCESKKIFEEML